ncbi:MAG TPA: response regulator [Pyrinomonadaceae bacterium]|nr:response regulator [Pyrinomonadaceae bacterium]
MPVAKRRILCIDNRASRSLAIFLLKRAGYEVLATHSMSAALELARSTRLDLYLLNHKLLEGGGAKLCTELSGAAPHTPILLYSTVIYPFRRRPAIRCGKGGGRTKPVVVTEVAGAVARMLNAQSWCAADVPSGAVSAKHKGLSTRAKVLAGTGVGAAALLIMALARGWRSIPKISCGI